MTRSRFAFVFASFVSIAVPAESFAAPACDKGSVGKLVADANTAFGAQKYDAAVTAYESAFACNHDVSLLFNVAKADLELGRYLDGLDAMRKFEKGSPDLPKDVRAAADDVIAQLAAHVGTLTVHSSEPGAHVSIGDKEIGTTPVDNVEVAEGTVSVRVVLAGRDPIVRQVEIKGGKPASVNADFAPPGGNNTPPPPAVETPKPSSTKIHPLVWAGVGVGGAGLIVAIGTGAASLVQVNKIKAQCPNNRCLATTEPDRSKANTLANVSNVSWGVAGVGAILGVVGAVLTVKSSKQESTSLVVGPGSVELHAAW
jgi:hypothetical protein